MWLLAVDPANLSLGQYGFLGTALMATVSATVYLAKAWNKRESERGDRLEQQLNAVNQQQLSTLTEKVIPALMESTAAVKESTDLQKKIYDKLLESPGLAK